jgi:hypothetical protein
MDIINLNGAHIRVNALWMVKTKNTHEELNVPTVTVIVLC